MRRKDTSYVYHTILIKALQKVKIKILFKAYTSNSMNELKSSPIWTKVSVELMDAPNSDLGGTELCVVIEVHQVKSLQTLIIWPLTPCSDLRLQVTDLCVVCDTPASYDTSMKSHRIMFNSSEVIVQRTLQGFDLWSLAVTLTFWVRTCVW